MTAVLSFAALILALLAPGVQAIVPDTVDLRSGKGIQLDGFLVEWSVSTALAFGKVPRVQWDALCTPEGLAGYILCRDCSSPACDKPELRIFTHLGAFHHNIAIPIQADSTGPFSRTTGDTSETIAEFLVPWDRLAVDTLGRFSAGVVLYVPCRDTTEAVIVRGNKKTPGAGVFTPGVQVRIAVALGLLFVYLAFLVSIKRKRTRPRESLHR